MVFDCFTFFNELDLLEIRLNVLNDVVDKFVLVEATKTHQGKDKPLFFSENKARFSKFSDKIIHVIINKYPPNDGTSAWTLERYQRDMIMEGLKDAKTGDVVMISDLDEIPKPELVKAYKGKRGIKVFRQQSYYYFINCKNISDGDGYGWCGTVMAPFNPKLTPQTLRFVSIQFAALYSPRFKVRVYYRLKMIKWKFELGSNTYAVKNGGWHFSFLGGVEMIIKKLEAFAHSEYNKGEYKDPKKIEEALNEGKDIFGRNFRYKFVPLDNSFPEYILKNKDKYSHLVKEITNR